MKKYKSMLSPKMIKSKWSKVKRKNLFLIGNVLLFGSVICALSAPNIIDTDKIVQMQKNEGNLHVANEPKTKTVTTTNVLKEEKVFSNKTAVAAVVSENNKNQAKKNDTRIIKSIKKTSRSEPRLKHVGTFKVSAYTSNEGGSRTASGTKVTPGKTVAADWNVIPKGTLVKIEGVEGVLRVEDKGGAIKGKKLDRAVHSVQEAKEWGIQHRDVYIVEN